MTIQQSAVDLLLGKPESATDNVSLSDSFNLLDSKLVAELIKYVVQLVQELEKLLARVQLHYQIKVLDIDEAHRYFSLFHQKVVVLRSYLVSYERWNQQV